MRTCSGHDNAPGKQVHAALQHLSTLGAQLAQPGCQPACTAGVFLRTSVRLCHACQALAGQDQGEHLSNSEGSAQQPIAGWQLSFGGKAAFPSVLVS